MPYIDVPRWAGSLASSLPPEETVPGDFVKLENFIYDSTGFPVVRGGRRLEPFGLISESFVPKRIRGLSFFSSGWVSGTAEEWIICYAGTKVYASVGGGTWVTILTGLQEGLSPTFATLRGWLIMASGSSDANRPYYWDGASDTMLPLYAAPPAWLVASHAGRLWVSTRDYPSRLDFSALYEPQEWNTDKGGGNIYINPGDGNHISALVPGYAGEMIIFKDGPNGGAIYRLQGLTPDNFSVTPLSTTIGCVNSRAATLVGDRDVFFASRRGIHSLKRTFEHGDLETSFIDREISSFWASLSDEQKARAVAVDDYTNDTWWLFVDSDGDGLNDMAVLFNYRHQSARGNPKISSVTIGADAACMYREKKIGRNFLMTGGTGYVFTEGHPEANDDTSPIAWEAVLAPINAGDSFAYKAWKNVWLRHDVWGTYDATVEWWTDNQKTRTSSISLAGQSYGGPFAGGVKFGEMRGLPAATAKNSLIHMNQGGIAMILGISGTVGKFRLRGMRIEFDGGSPIVGAEDWGSLARPGWAP